MRLHGIASQGLCLVLHADFGSIDIFYPLIVFCFGGYLPVLVFGRIAIDRDFEAYRSNCRIFLSRSASIGQIAGWLYGPISLPFSVSSANFVMQSEAQWGSAGVQPHEE